MKDFFRVLISTLIIPAYLIADEIADEPVKEEIKEETQEIEEQSDEQEKVEAGDVDTNIPDLPDLPTIGELLPTASLTNIAAFIVGREVVSVQ